MLSATKAYLRDEGGAVTVDWVVLTAAVVGLGMATIAVVSAGTEDLSRDIDDQLNVDHITASFDDPIAGVWGELALVNSFGTTQEGYDNAVDGWIASEGGWTEAYTKFSTEAMDTTQSASARADDVDMLGAIEARMIAENRDLPEGQATYAETHAAWQADHG